MNSFSRRCLRLPLPTNSARQSRQLLRLAEEIAEGDVAEVAQRVRRGHGSAQWRGERSGGAAGEGAPLTQLRARLFANALVDLAEGGWSVEVEGSDVHVTAPDWKRGAESGDVSLLRREKDAVRASLVARAVERLQTPGARRFIRRLEAGGVLRLVAQGPALASSLRERGAAAVQPFLQMARPSDGAEQGTGLALHDVYRYLRYTWSFPYESTPGRTLPFLIRDAGQPGAPVCGLLCLTSPVPRLEARDASFGWSVGSLAAQVRGLGAVEDAGEGPAERRRVGDALEAAAAIAAAEAPDDAPRERAAGVLASLSRSLSLRVCRSADLLAREAFRLSPSDRRARARSARRRIAEELLSELKETLESTSFKGLPVTFEEALAAPQQAAEELSGVADAARSQLRGDPSAQREAFQGLLYEKKRAKLLSRLLPAWAALEPLRSRRGDPEALRAALEAAVQPGDSAQAVAAAMTRRRTRFLASQVAEVSVCGAVPPYGPALGGKLAGLLALSADVAGYYHSAYQGRCGEIQAQMAGREIALPTNLVGLSTSSFYPVGSAQYNRLALPDGLGGARWRRVGASRGVGTLHFSRATSELAAELLRALRGRVESRYGEGPSERIRKLRDGLRLLEMPVSQLLEHGMRRPSYTAILQSGSAFGDPCERVPYHQSGPPADSVARYWRERWLAPRLERKSTLPQIEGHAGDAARISRLIEPQSQPDLFNQA